MSKKKSSKARLLYENILKVVKQYVSGRSYTPLSESDLLSRLGFPPQHLPVLQDALEALVLARLLERHEGRYFWKGNGSDFVTGILRVHPRGFGFLQPDKSASVQEEIFIPKHLTMNAVDGDIVEVAINTKAVSEKGPEGKVTAIIERSRTHIAGTIRTIESNGDIVVYVPLLGTGRRVIVQPTSEQPLTAGDRIIMEVIEWGSQNTETLCRFSHMLGSISDPSCDIPSAIEEYQLRNSFPQPAIEEALGFGTQVTAEDIEGREDLRNMECFTIDPDTAKDFDDALSLSKDKQGRYHLGVHIADVSHYVKPGTALDHEAALRCNSTYFPNFCLPMLPPALSENLCSLKPRVNRLTVSVLMTLDPKGALIDYKIVRAVIKSAKRFTYKEAKKVLDGEVKSPHLKTLKLMVELCGHLKRIRYERGSIEFSLPELVILVNDRGEPEKTDLVLYDITHQMVEEFMLKANEVVAWHLANQGKNLTYRVHDEPAVENLRDFVQLAGAFGYQLPDNPTPGDLQKMFDDALETSYGAYLATSFIRRMRLAIYSPDNIGHYGLALTHYCHFTSPIRRYIDLVVHRLLFGASDDREKMQEISLNCSEQERISSRAEMSTILLKKLRLLQKMREAEPGRTYEAVITRLKPFGFFFEVLDLMLEGFLHVSDLEQDFFIFDEARMQWKGRRTGIIYAPGTRIEVMPQSLDLISLESTWYLVPPKQKSETAAAPKTSLKKKPSVSRKKQPKKPAKPKGTKKPVVRKKAPQRKTKNKKTAPSPHAIKKKNPRSEKRKPKQ